MIDNKNLLSGLEEFDLGFTTFSANEIAEVKEYQQRLLKIRELIMPFLENLMKSPEKDIHWPNRDVKIGKFKKTLEDIIEYGRVIEDEPVIEPKNNVVKR